MEVDDVREGEAFEDNRLIVRWATDPAGRVHRISAEVPRSPDFPIFTPDAEDGLLPKLLLRRANRLIKKGYERGERREAGSPTWYLDVQSTDVEDETVLFEEELEDRQGAQQRVEELAEQVVAGTFKEQS